MTSQWCIINIISCEKRERKTMRGKLVTITFVVEWSDEVLCLIVFRIKLLSWHLMSWWGVRSWKSWELLFKMLIKVVFSQVVWWKWFNFRLNLIWFDSKFNLNDVEYLVFVRQGSTLKTNLLIGPDLFGFHLKRLKLHQTMKNKAKICLLRGFKFWYLTWY